MNEEVEKTISGSLNGFQWVLGAMVVLLILYGVVKNWYSKKDK